MDDDESQEKADAHDGDEGSGSGSGTGSGSDPRMGAIKPARWEELVGSGRLNAPLAGVLWRNHDGDHSNAAIKILPVVAASPHSLGLGGGGGAQGSSQGFTQGGGKYGRPDIRILTPLLRLVAACSKSHEGNLSEMDAMVGCPILAVDSSDMIDEDGKSLPGFDQLPASAQETAALCHLYTADWCIDVINTFVREPEAETRSKVRTSLMNKRRQLQRRLASNVW